MGGFLDAGFFLHFCPATDPRLFWELMFLKNDSNMAGLAGGSNNLLRFQKCKGLKESRGFRSENMEGSQTQKAQRTCRLGPLTTTSMEALGESRFFFLGGFFANAVIVTQILQQRCGSLHFCNQDVTKKEASI